MDPNKGHGENIRTYNWTENGRRSFWTTENGRLPAPDSQNVRPNGVHFSVTADESAPVADLEGLRTRGLEIPADRNRHGPRNPSSTAKQNDKVPQGNIYRGVGGHFRIRHSTKYFVPSRLRGPSACYLQAECPPANRF